MPKLLVPLLAVVIGASPVMMQAARAEDAGKKACLADAKRLCPDAIRAMSRSRARACLITKIEQTSPECHSYMLKARAEAANGHSEAAH